MKICDLPAPVTAAKADWLPSTSWLGFTPTGKGPGAAAKCQATIMGQIAKGFVLERITDTFGEPNPGFNHSECIATDRAAHAEVADSLVAVHRLHLSSRPLTEIVGEDEFEKLQDIWSSNGQRNRWSVAFPIVESFKIIGAPKARDVFSVAVFRRHFQYTTAVLRPLDDEARSELAELEIVASPAQNLWIILEDEAKIAEMSEIDPWLQELIGADLAGALEGESEERRTRARKRAAWLANKFYLERKRRGKVFCDDCGFDPRDVKDIPRNRLRSCLDVHHKDPLAEGIRLTTISDFALLCPTCHRIEHIRIDLQGEN